MGSNLYGLAAVGTESRTFSQRGTANTTSVRNNLYGLWCLVHGSTAGGTELIIFRNDSSANGARVADGNDRGFRNGFRRNGGNDRGFRNGFYGSGRSSRIRCNRFNGNFGTASHTK